VLCGWGVKAGMV